MSAAVNLPLTAGELTALNGVTTCKTYLFVASNTAVAAGNLANNFAGYPVSTIVYLGSSGNWTNVAVGMTLKITSPGGVLRGYYRVNDVSAAGNPNGTIGVGAIGQGDPGLLTGDLRTVDGQAGDIITAYNRFDVWAVIPRIDYTTPASYVIYEDYNKAYASANGNYYPAPMCQVSINNGIIPCGPGYAQKVDAGQTYATIRFDVLATLWPTSGAVSYVWTLPVGAGWTLVAGGLTTATITVRVPRSATNYVLKLVVSEANGGSQTRWINVWVWDDVAPYAPMTVDAISSDMRDRTGRKMTFKLNNTRLASIPDGALVHIQQEATWNHTTREAGGYSFTNHFNGWVIHENREISEPGLFGAEVSVVGPAGLLEMLNANDQYFKTVSGVPANWQELYVSIGDLRFVIHWLLAHRTTLLTLCEFVSWSDARYQAGWDIQPGTLLSQIQNLAARWGANFGCDSFGQLVTMQHPSLTTYSTRGANIVLRDSVVASQYGTPATLERNLKARTRWLRGEAFNITGGPTTYSNTPFLCDAPDTYPGQGGSDEKFESQLVLSQAELNTRTGHEYARRNSQWPRISIPFPYNRDCYEPVYMYFVNVTIPANLSPDGAQWQRNVVPMQISKTYHEDGTVEISFEGEPETAGLPATTVAIPPI